MPFEVQSVPEGTDLVLAGRLGVQQAGLLWEALRPAIDSPTAIRLNASAVEEMDTSIVQILCRVGGRAGRLRIGETSDGFLDSLKRRGLDKFFMTSSETPDEGVASLKASPPEAEVAVRIAGVKSKAKNVSRSKRPNRG